MRRHLVVRILLDEGDDDGLWRRLAELLVCSTGVAAWQMDRYDHDELGDRPGQDLPDEALEAALAAVGS
jgi:hypothetical protein